MTSIYFTAPEIGYQPEVDPCGYSYVPENQQREDTGNKKKEDEYAYANEHFDENDYDSAIGAYPSYCRAICN